MTQQLNHRAVLKFFLEKGWKQDTSGCISIIYKGSLDTEKEPTLIGYVDDLWVFIQRSDTKDAIRLLVDRLGRGVVMTCEGGHDTNSSWDLSVNCKKCGKLLFEK